MIRFRIFFRRQNVKCLAYGMSKDFLSLVPLMMLSYDDPYKKSLLSIQVVLDSVKNRFQNLASDFPRSLPPLPSEDFWSLQIAIRPLTGRSVPADSGRGGTPST